MLAEADFPIKTSQIKLIYSLFWVILDLLSAVPPIH